MEASGPVFLAGSGPHPTPRPIPTLLPWDPTGSEPSKSAPASGLTKKTVPTPGLGAKPDIDGPVVDDFITVLDPDFVRICSPFLSITCSVPVLHPRQGKMYS